MKKTEKQYSHWKRLLLLTLVLVTAVAVYFTAVPKDLSDWGPLIKSKIGEHINAEVDIEGISLIILPFPRIRLTGVTLRDDREVILASRSVRMSISILKLFQKKIEIKRLLINQGKIVLRRDRDGVINFSKILPKEAKEGRLPFSVSSLSAKKIDVTVIDEMPATPARFDLVDIDILLQPSLTGLNYSVKGRSLPEAKFSFSGFVRPAKGGWSHSGTLTVEDLLIGPVASYLKDSRYSLAGSISFDTDYSLKWGKDFQSEGLIKGTVDYKDLKVGFPTAFNRPIESRQGSTKMEFTWWPERQVLTLEDTKLEMEGFSVEGKARLAGPAGSMGLDMELKTTSVPVWSLIDLMPVKILPPSVGDTIASTRSAVGSVRLKGFRLRAQLDDIMSGAFISDPSSLSASMEITDLWFRIEKLAKRFKGINADLSLSEGVMKITGLTGHYGNSLIREMEAELKYAQKNSAYSIKMQSSSEASDTVDELMTLFGSESGFTRFFAPIELSGRLSLGLHIHGIRGGTERVKYSCRLTVADGAFTHAKLPVAFSDVSGMAEFDEKKITIGWAKALAGGSPVNVNGAIKAYRSSPFIDLRMDGTLASRTLSPLAARFKIKELEIEGGAPFTGSITGVPETVLISTDADFKDVSIKYGEFLNKAPGTAMRVKGGALLSREHIKIKDGLISILESSLTLNGIVPRDGAFGYVFQLSSDNLLVEDAAALSPYLAEIAGLKGLAALDITLEETPDGEAEEIVGEISLQDGYLHTRYLNKPIEGLNATLKIDKDRRVVTIDGMRIGESRLMGEVDIFDFKDRVIGFDLYSPFINIEDFAVASASIASTVKKRTIGRGTLEVAHGTALGVSFSDFSTDMALTADTVRFPLSLKTHGGTVAGVMEYFRDPAEQKLFTTDLEFKEVRIEPLFEELGLEKTLLTGKLKGSAALTFLRGVTPPSSRLNGNLSIKVKGGRLWKFVALGKIFSIVNIISINELFEEGHLYKQIKGDFTFKDGVVSTKNLVLKSDNLRMSAVGELDMPSELMDLTFGLHPFVTIDKIITEFPLVGWIIGGKEKSVITMYYKITGPIGNPEVNPLPVKSVGGKILGIFQRLFEGEEKGSKEEPAAMPPPPPETPFEDPINR